MFVQTAQTYNEFGDIDSFLRNGAFRNSFRVYTKSNLTPRQQYALLATAQERADQYEVVVRLDEVPVPASNFRSWNAALQDPTVPRLTLTAAEQQQIRQGEAAEMERERLEAFRRQ